ncbi:MAG: TrkA family potassium uptake protein [Candidatus Mcinerneyibacterium aminivorans]|uniref:Trk system potassium uptake protein TrkA n=1 Tax=Candidatus Mcinerneyibacterium aminivorans TaxID=2703815 RepID=A0A5D0MIT8_9BACT|nr:MAG: TrkA family potassium uptake protein [Candidatus Mcinerneyibacterium aminivorans]
MQINLVGGGKLLFHLAKKLISQGHELVIINKEEENSKYYARNLNAKVINGDATDPIILEDADTYKADILISLIQKDYENLFICQMGKIYFDVEKTAALVNNPDNETLFKQLGIEVVFNITDFLTSLIERNILIEDIKNIFTLEEGNISISQIIIPEDAQTIGTKIKNLEFPQNSMIGPILRNNNIIIPKGNTELKANDKVLILSLPDKQSEAIKLLGGKI